MGISSMSSPSEGVLTILVVNTVLTISILKQIVRSILRFFGVRSPDPGPEQPPTYYSAPCKLTVMEHFRSRFKPVWFGSGLARQRHGAVVEWNADCRVCLARFEPESVVNRLACDHFFHCACLEKWLDYHHVTCPLCLTYLLGGGGVAPAPPVCSPGGTISLLASSLWPCLPIVLLPYLVSLSLASNLATSAPLSTV